MPIEVRGAIELKERQHEEARRKVAVVTGGNSGIGLATAKRLQEEGARVAILGRSRKTLDEAVKTIGNGVVSVQGDVAKLTDIDKLYAEVSQKLGKIDVLFVNAGVAKFAPFAETSESTYDESFDINIKGAYFIIQKALPLLNDDASIILNTSVCALAGQGCHLGQRNGQRAGPVEAHPHEARRPSFLCRGLCRNPRIGKEHGNGHQYGAGRV